MVLVAMNDEASIIIMHKMAGDITLETLCLMYSK